MRKINVTKKLFAFGVFALSAISVYAANIVAGDGVYVAQGSNYSVNFDATTGSITRIISEGKDSNITTPDGLWSAVFKDGKRVNASSVSCSAEAKSNMLTFKYSSEFIDVTVTVTPKNRYCDLRAKLAIKSGELMKFELPSSFVFPPEAVSEITMQSTHPRNTGLVLLPAFFDDNSKNANNTMMNYSEPFGDKLYKMVFGNSANSSKRVLEKLTKGKDSDEWVASDLMDLILKSSYYPARTFKDGSADIELARGPSGVFLGGSRLGGKGAIFRIGGWVDEYDRDKMRDMVCCLIHKAKREAKGWKSKRHKVGVVKVNGIHGNFAKWHRHLNRVCKNVVVLDGGKAVADALKDPEFLFIVNPYFETCPNPVGVSPEETVKQIVEFVKAGGFWFDNEGYSFYYGVMPKKYYRVDGSVPAGVGDFFHLDMGGAKIAYFSVQNISGASFKNPSKSFTVSDYTFGGSDRGGFIQRPFVRYMKPADGEWTTPKVRLSFGKDLQSSADAFCKANGATKKLSQKADKEFLEKFKDCVLLMISVRNLEQVKLITDAMPERNIIHLPCYLLGGFDKQYPDHVPPRPDFSTAEDFKAYIAEIRKNGHLFMPYTNNSWWCDKPRGPTFVAAGEAPLSVDINGKHYHERYAKNEGWTICMWHPDVRAANDKLVKDFTEDYPCDILFQDQTGARASKLDFNPAAPNPNTYSDGFIFTAREDAKKIPLSTEDGWWGIVNEEIQFCGMSFGIFPSHLAPPWNVFVWDMYPKNTMRLANLTGALFHDKVSLSHHDLGTGIFRDKQMALSLGIGFTLMYSPHLHTIKNQYDLHFIKWMDRLQKSIVSKYIGAKMKSFKHWWQDVNKQGGDGYIRSQYGNIKIFANMTDAPVAEGDVIVSDDGFIAEGDGVKAGMVDSINGVASGLPFCGYVVDGLKAWTYATGGEYRIFPYSGKIKRLKVKGGADLKFEQKNGVVKFKLPITSDEDKHTRKLTELEIF